MRATRQGRLVLPGGELGEQLDAEDMRYYFGAYMRSPRFEWATDLAIEERELTDWAKCAHKVPKRP